MFSSFASRYGVKNSGDTTTVGNIIAPETSLRTDSRNKLQQITIVPNSDSSLIEDNGEDREEDNNVTSSSDTTASSDAMDFAYINVTDEDEVDIWLETSTNSIYDYNTDVGKYRDQTRFLFSNKNNGSGDWNGQTPKNSAADILTILLSGNIRNQQQLGLNNLRQSSEENDKDSKSLETKSLSTSVAPNELMMKTIEEANVASAEAANAKIQGHLQDAFKKHCEAAKFFHQAALVLAKDYKNGK
jgi:hypothetical protein